MRECASSESSEEGELDWTGLLITLRSSPSFNAMFAAVKATEKEKDKKGDDKKEKDNKGETEVVRIGINTV